jgi:chromate reductase
LDLLPHYNPGRDIPEPILEFRKDREKADTILIVSPEYIFSTPAVLKKALDWCVSTEVSLISQLELS